VARTRSFHHALTKSLAYSSQENAVAYIQLSDLAQEAAPAPIRRGSDLDNPLLAPMAVGTVLGVITAVYFALNAQRWGEELGQKIVTHIRKKRR